MHYYVVEFSFDGRKWFLDPSPYDADFPSAPVQGYPRATGGIWATSDEFCVRAYRTLYEALLHADNAEFSVISPQIRVRSTTARDIASRLPVT